jgi:hypothetical protein
MDSNESHSGLLPSHARNFKRLVPGAPRLRGTFETKTSGQIIGKLWHDRERVVEWRVGFPDGKRDALDEILFPGSAASTSAPASSPWTTGCRATSSAKPSPRTMPLSTFRTRRWTRSSTGSRRVGVFIGKSKGGLRAPLFAFPVQAKVLVPGAARFTCRLVWSPLRVGEYNCSIPWFSLTFQYPAFPF